MTRPDPLLLYYLLLILLVVVFVFFLLGRRVRRSSIRNTGKQDDVSAAQNAPAFSPPPTRSSHEPAGGPEKEDPLGTLLKFATTVFIVFKSLQKGYSFLKNLDWDSLDAVVKEAIGRFGEDIQKIRDNGDRLNRAESLVNAGDKLSIDEAAMLASATLEAGLKTLCERNAVILDADKIEGMAGIAIALSDEGIISAHDCREVKKYVNSIRNKVMHGDFDNLDEDDVRQQLDFTRELFSSHGLM